jgi:hypothetical protein
MGRPKRDRFTRATIEALADRAGNRCSNPKCREPTSGPCTDPTKAINIGMAAHITAASEGGPRYDPSLTSKRRGHPDNGTWLCQNCAKLIDNDPERYLESDAIDGEGTIRREVELQEWARPLFADLLIVNDDHECPQGSSKPGQGITPPSSSR